MESKNIKDVSTSEFQETKNKFKEIFIFAGVIPLLIDFVVSVFSISIIKSNTMYKIMNLLLLMHSIFIIKIFISKLIDAIKEI